MIKGFRHQIMFMWHEGVAYMLDSRSLETEITEDGMKVTINSKEHEYVGQSILDFFRYQTETIPNEIIKIDDVFFERKSVVENGLGKIDDIIKDLNLYEYYYYKYVQGDIKGLIGKLKKINTYKVKRVVK